MTPPGELDPAPRIAGFLLFHGDLDYCDACLAAALELAAGEVPAAAAELARAPTFLRDRWLCHRCGRWGSVTRALPTRALSLKHPSRARRLRQA